MLSLLLKIVKLMCQYVYQIAHPKFADDPQLLVWKNDSVG